MKHKTRTKVLSWLLSLALMLSLLPSMSLTAYADDTKVGTATYTISDGVLTVGSGTFTAAEFSQAFSSQKANIRRVSFEQGATMRTTKSNAKAEKIFAEWPILESVDMTNLTANGITSIHRMFYKCTALKSVLFGASFDTSKVTAMSDVFSDCKSLITIDISHFNTTEATSMSGIFRNCSALTSLDLSSFNTAKVTDMSSMFYACSKMKTIYVSESWNTDAVTNSSYMFYQASSLKGGSGTTYSNVSSTQNVSRAHVDGGQSNPGYLTLKGHMHSFSYALSDDHTTITATCTGDGECDLSDNHTVSIKITAPKTLTTFASGTSGSPAILNRDLYRAPIEGATAFNEATNHEVRDTWKDNTNNTDTRIYVQYYKIENSTETSLGTEPPCKEAGNYRAKITVENLTAYVDYTLESLKYEGAPTSVVATVTDTAVNIHTPAQQGETYEYQVGNGEWTTNPSFTGLNPHTQYTIGARMKEHPSDTVVTGTATTWYTTTIEGTAKVGQTLTANVTDLTPESDYEFSWYVGTTEHPAHGKTYTIKVSDVGKTAELHVVRTSNRFVVGKAYTDLITAKTELGASDFTFTAPTNLAYNGEQKTATVSCSKEGVGAITVEYWRGDGFYSTTAPKDVGTYTVKISIPETDDYSKVEHFTADGWTFTISKAAATISAENLTDAQKPTAKTEADLYYTGSPVNLVTAPTSVPDDYKVEYSINDGVSWSEDIPTGTDVGNYTVKVKYVNISGNYEDVTLGEGISVAITVDKSAFASDIEKAEEYYNSIKDSNPDAAATLLAAINTAKAVKDNADATQEQVDAALSAITAAKAAAKLAEAKNNAKSTVNAVNAAAYINTDQQTVTNAKSTALAAIDAATTTAEVETALNTFNTSIASCTTQEAADTAAANAVSNTINALPVANEVTGTNKDAIEAARAAYTALTASQKARVSTDTLKKLTADEAALAIAELPAANNVTADNKAAIEAAREKYNALTDDQKTQVGNNALTKLTTTEAALAIAELPAAKNVTASNKTAIEAAREKYNALTDDQKTQVGNDALAKLTAAETALAIVSATEPTTITLDGPVTGPITIPAGKEITLDLNGKTVTGGVTVNGKAVIKDSTGTGVINGGVTVENSGEVSIESGTVNDGVTVKNGGKATVTSGTVNGDLTVQDGGTLTVTGGTFSDPDVLKYIDKDDENADVTVKLSKDETLSDSPVTLDIKGKVTIDLNGHTLTGGVNVGKDAEVTIKPEGTITGNIENSGKLNINGGTFGGTITNNEGATLNITNGTFNGTVTNKGTAIIDGGTFGGTITNNEGGTLTINGGTFNGDVTNSGTLTVNGGTFNGDVTNKDTMTVNSGTFASGKSVTTTTENGKTTINGGTFKGNVASTVSGTTTIKGGLFDNKPTATTSGSVSIEGGKFKANPTESNDGVTAASGKQIFSVDGKEYPYQVIDKPNTNAAAVKVDQGETTATVDTSKIASEDQADATSVAQNTTADLEEAAVEHVKQIVASSTSVNDDTKNIVIVPALEVKAEAYTVSEGNATMTLDIEAIYKSYETDSSITNATQIKNNTDTNKVKEIGSGKLDTTGKAVDVKIEVPAAFAQALGATNETSLANPVTVFVKHIHNSKSFEYRASLYYDGSSKYFVEFTNPNGFSPFTLSKTSASVVTAMVNGENRYYTDIESALNDIPDGATLTLTKNDMTDDDLAAVINSVKEITIAKGETNNDLSKLNITAGSGLNITKTTNDDGTVTFKTTKRSSGGNNGGNNGGSGGSYSGGSSGGSSSSSGTTYAPTVSNSSNGTVSINPTSPKSGDKVTITAKPSKGYEVDAVTVTDANGKTVAVTKNADGTYTFTQPSSKVKIDVTFKAAQTAPASTAEVFARYSDLDASGWYADGVRYALENGIMSGYGNGKFGPGDTTSRAMIAQILYNLEGKPAYSGMLNYTDVDANDWYAAAIRWANAESIIDGYGNHLFGPNDVLTREQLVTILYRYAKSKGVDVSGQTSLTGYHDAASVSGWAEDAMQWAVAAGVVTGKGDGILDPKGNATRSEIATIMMRYCENIAK